MRHLFLILFIQFVFVHLSAQTLGKNIAYSDDNVRFTVISDGVMRLEYSPDGEFVDNKSFLAVERVYPSVDYKVKQTRRSVEITTSKMKLTYKKAAESLIPQIWKLFPEKICSPLSGNRAKTEKQSERYLSYFRRYGRYETNSGMGTRQQIE